MRNLYIDFDGVIMDTTKVGDRIIEQLGIDKGDYEKISLFYQTLNWKEFLLKTPIINDGVNCIYKLIESGKFNISILTHINSLDEAVEKVKFIRTYFKDITVIPVPRAISKTKMIHTEGSILVDDYSGNLKEWEKEGGIGVKFSNNPSSKGFITISKLDQLLDIDFEQVTVG